MKKPQIKTIQVAVEGAEVIPHEKLEPFQGELKRLEREDYERFRNTILEDGFSFTIHIWKHKGKNYIIDGHQRLTCVKMMAENEGYTIPPLPVSIVKAKDFAAAKRKILAGISQFGKYTEKTMFEFMRENDIPIDKVVANFSFPQLDMEKFTAMFDVSVDDVIPANSQQPDHNLQSRSDGVRQINLFFDAESHAEFSKLIGVLNMNYETENISDTVLEALREVVAAGE